MTQLTPEQAQQQIKADWTKRAAGERVDRECGWCAFTDNDCRPCPVKKVMGWSCLHIPQYNAWSRAMRMHARSKKMATAAVVLELVINHGDEFVALGHEALIKAKQ